MFLNEIKGPFKILNEKWAALWSALAVHVTELQVIGVILLIAATLFTLWSRLVLGTMWSSAAAVKSDHQLRTGGPYRVTRHPIYTGILGMLAGTTLMFVSAWPVLLICSRSSCLRSQMRSNLWPNNLVSSMWSTRTEFRS
jgi:protein-S-isoprenylcysteine O-methyltransferase Ste14